MTKEEYEQIHTLNCGRFLNFMAKTEYLITQILIDHYNSLVKTDKITAELKKICTQEYTNFETRKKVFFSIVESKFPGFIEINPKLFFTIDRLSKLRNVIAHSPIIPPKNIKEIKVHTLEYLILGSIIVKESKLRISYTKFHFNSHENSILTLAFLNSKLEILWKLFNQPDGNSSYTMGGKALDDLI